MNDEHKKILEQARRERRMCDELMAFADDCAQAVNTPNFWYVGAKSDELVLLNTIKGVMECFASLNSMNYADIDKERLSEIMNYYEGRALLSFIRCALPDLLDGNETEGSERFENYLSVAYEPNEGDIEDRLSIICDYIAIAEYSSRPLFLPTENTVEGMENSFFDKFRWYALRAIRFVYDRAIEEFNTSYKVIEQDPALGKKTAKSGISKAERVTPLLWRLLLRSFGTNAANLILILLATLCNNCAASYHNLAIALKNEDDEGDLYEEYELKKEKSTARLWTYYALSTRVIKNTEALNLIQSMPNNRDAKGPMRHLDLFATSIELGEDMLKSFLDTEAEGWLQHWYNDFAQLMKRADSEIQEKMGTVANYLLHTLNSVSTKRILYHSNFYELLTCAYCYKFAYYEQAHKIIYNGYDYYLELGTLWLIFKCNRRAFAREIGKLKAICLKRNLAMTGESYYATKRYIRDLYGDDFVDEFVRLATDSLSKIDPSNAADVRNRDERLTPEWAKKRPEQN